MTQYLLPEELYELYSKSLRGMLRRFYQIIRDYRMLAREHQTFIQGYMAAGKVLGLVTNDQLKEIMEEENFDVFGMTIGERNRKTPVKRVSVEDDEYLDIPTILRRGLSVK
jgi:hypothetical protein